MTITSAAPAPKAEPLTIRAVTPVVFQVSSHDGNKPQVTYVVTEHSCTCPHWVHRHDNEDYWNTDTGLVCKHMAEVRDYLSGDLAVNPHSPVSKVRPGSEVRLAVPRGLPQRVTVVAVLADVYGDEHKVIVTNGLTVKRTIPLSNVAEVITY